MTRSALLLLGVPAAVGVIAGGAAGLLLGPRHWGFAAAAFGLCVPPGVVTLVLANYLIRSSPLGALLALFVGTAVRLVVGIGGAAAVILVGGVDDSPGRVAFLFWLLFAYLVTLVVETGLLRRLYPPGR